MNREKRDILKLYEIAVYALSKEKLKKRVDKKIHKLMDDYNKPGVSEKILRQAIEIESYPQRLWEYNHIIGYIVIVKTGDDIVIQWYTTFPETKRYRWDSGKKKYFIDTHLNGYHFNVCGMNSGAKLRERIRELIISFNKTLESKGYYVDLESFNNIDALVDYDKLLDIKRRD